MACLSHPISYQNKQRMPFLNLYALLLFGYSEAPTYIHYSMTADNDGFTQ